MTGQYYRSANSSKYWYTICFAETRHFWWCRSAFPCWFSHLTNCQWPHRLSHLSFSTGFSKVICLCFSLSENRDSCFCGLECARTWACCVFLVIGICSWEDPIRFMPVIWFAYFVGQFFFCGNFDGRVCGWFLSSSFGFHQVGPSCHHRSSHLSWWPFGSPADPSLIWNSKHSKN